MLRNINSDFKVVVPIKNPLFYNAAFRFLYYTEDKNQHYVAEWNGEDSPTGNVFTEDGGKTFIITFPVDANQTIGVGQVNVTRQFTIADDHFKDGVMNKTYNEVTNIELTEGMSDEDGDIIATPVGLHIVKPKKGIDYMTDSEMQQIYSSAADAANASLDLFITNKIAEAMATANQFATNKAELARTMAIDHAAADATTKAMTARNESINIAAEDASAKADAAKLGAIEISNAYTDDKISLAQNEVIEAAKDAVEEYVAAEAEKMLQGSKEYSDEKLAELEHLLKAYVEAKIESAVAEMKRYADMVAGC